MDNLFGKVTAIRPENETCQGRRFVPQPLLRGVMSLSAIKSCLDEIAIPNHGLDSLPLVIHEHAWRCFAMLIMIRRSGAIDGFLKHNALQWSSPGACPARTPDDRVPYTRGNLRRVVELEQVVPYFVVDEFFEKQWDISVPKMHRNLLS